MMNKLRGTIVAIFAAGALACAALAMAQAVKRPPPVNAPYESRNAAILRPSDDRAIGVNVVRLINTAEAEYKSAHSGYATWSELYRSGLIAEHEKPGLMFGNLRLSEGPEVVPGWTLAMLVSVDNQSYELSLRNLQDLCQFSLFSDQRGLIFRGVVIDCSAALVPAHE